jgi:thiamine-monophosphate kinase
LPADVEATLRVRELGEFGLIDRLQARIVARGTGLSAAGGLELGIGDDAAVWLPAAGARQVITTDALIEDVHFRRSTTSWRDLGWKALAVNVSDVAAMGATPRHALITLGLPGETLLADILALYDGFLDLAELYGLQIIGGDVVSAQVVVLNVTVIGEASGPLLRRDAGRAGEALAVTGALGGSTGGLLLLEAGRVTAASDEPLLIAHLRPRPRVAEAALLVEAGVRCGMDLSDGLLGDSAHLCERSGLSATLELERVPIAPRLLEAFGADALDLAVGGGEDYELLCAAPLETIERARLALAALGTSLTVVGRLEPRRAGEPLVRLVDRAGRPARLSRASWDHFRG